MVRVAKSLTAKNMVAITGDVQFADHLERIAFNALPTQATNVGKFLTTDGTNASWATVDALPSQSGQAGEFLTTDGTSADWISDAGQIETPGNYYKNYNEIAVATTTTVPTTENGIVFGPINSTAEWTINGTLVIL